MTATVIIQTHGWAVDVIRRDPATGETIGTERIENGESRSVCANSSVDLLIHEVPNATVEGATLTGEQMETILRALTNLAAEDISTALAVIAETQPSTEED